MTITVRILNSDDAALLDRVAEDVFDEPVNARWAAEFLGDPRHHVAVAVEGEQVVGFASGVHYVHPDKPPELWVNEVGVSLAQRNRGVGRRLLAALFERARAVGCAQAWVGTERANAPARRLYAAAGGVEDPEDFVIVTFRLNGGGDGTQQ